MGWVKDNFLGGAEKKAAKDQIRAIERGQDITRAATDKATGIVTDMYAQAGRDANLGYQGALDIFGQSTPAQMDVFGQGNMAAQQAITNSMPQMQNALMGGQVDYSQFQPFQANMPDLSFLQAQLPEYGQPSAQPQDQQHALGGYKVQFPFFDNMPTFNPNANAGQFNNPLAGVKF